MKKKVRRDDVKRGGERGKGGRALGVKEEKVIFISIYLSILVLYLTKHKRVLLQRRMSKRWFTRGPLACLVNDLGLQVVLLLFTKANPNMMGNVKLYCTVWD